MMMVMMLIMNFKQVTNIIFNMNIIKRYINTFFARIEHRRAWRNIYATMTPEEISEAIVVGGQLPLYPHQEKKWAKETSAMMKKFREENKKQL